MNQVYLSKFFYPLLIFSIVALFSTGCSDEDTYYAPGVGAPRCQNTSKKFLIIETWNTESVQGGKKFNFSFYGCFNSTGSLPIKVKVIGGFNGGCIAYQNVNFISITSGTSTNYASFIAPSNFLSDCDSENRNYTVYASVEDGDTTRAIDPLMISFGNYPLGYSPEAKIEYDYNINYNFFNIDSTKKTFKDPNTTVPLNISTRGSASVITSSAIFTASSQNDLLNQLVSYMNTYRSTDTVNYPIYLHMSHKATIAGSPFAGVSYSRFFYNDKRNFSFVFSQNLQDILGVYYTQHEEYRKSANSFTISHELLHQMGIVFYEGCHYDHNNDTCVLKMYSEYPNHNNLFVAGRMSWKICPRHMNFIKNSPLLINHSGDHSGTVSSNITDSLNGHGLFKNESLLQLSLPKNRFKMFEPVLIKLTYKNFSGNPDTINSVFDKENHDFNFKILPLDGQDYRNDPPAYSITYFKNPMVINAKDSLVISGDINKYGVHLKANYFDMEGYLNPGKYRLLVSRIVNGSILTSDTVDFEIENLNDEDRFVLNLVQNGDFLQILNNYQNSPFYESVYAFYVLKSFRPKFAEKFASQDEILNLYENFSSRFPHSFSWYDASFVYYMITKLSIGSKAINDMFGKIENNLNNSSLNSFISQNVVKRKIQQTFQFVRKSVEESDQREKDYDSDTPKNK